MKAADKKFPMLLVVAEFPPNVADGGGALARQMLQGYPAEKIVWWSCLAGREAGFGREVREEFRFRLPDRLYPRRRWRGVKAWLLERIWTPRAARHLAGVVERVAPEQVWVVLHGWAIPVVDRIGLIAMRKCHVSVWDFQDHQLSRPRFGTDERVARSVRTVETMYRTAASADAVSRPMWEDLARQTGRRDALVVHSGVEPAQLEALAAPESESGDPEIRIAYAGAIIAADTFALCIRALNGVRGQLGKPLFMEFFGGHDFAAEPWFDAKWMRVHGTVDDARLSQVLGQCQWGFAPMDLHDDNARYNRFSIPNKVGTYLAAGLPVLVAGHRESSAVRTVRDYGAGFWSDAREATALGESLRRELCEGRSKARYREAIVRCAQGEFDAEAIRSRLWSEWGVRPVA